MGFSVGSTGLTRTEGCLHRTTQVNEPDLVQNRQPRLDSGRGSSRRQRMLLTAMQRFACKGSLLVPWEAQHFASAAIAVPASDHHLRGYHRFAATLQRARPPIQLPLGARPRPGPAFHWNRRNLLRRRTSRYSQSLEGFSVPRLRTRQKTGGPFSRHFHVAQPCNNEPTFPYGQRRHGHAHSRVSPHCRVDFGCGHVPFRNRRRRFTPGPIW